MKYDIVIAYRCYPGISKNPLFWSDSKLDMIRCGLKSMVVCLGSLKAKFIIIDDGCPDYFENKIRDVLSGFTIEYIKTNKIGNFATYKMQLDLLTKQNDSDIVYLAEDDYVYSHTGFKEAIDLLMLGIADFVTLFDHRGYYKARHHSIKSIFHITEKRVWKSVASTCLTFMTTKKNLKSTKSVLLLFTKKCWDHPMWLILTKYNLFRIFDINWKDRVWKILPFELIYCFMAWYYGFIYILFGKKYKLYAPIPSIATHLESEDIAPLVNWYNVKDFNQ